MSPFAVVVIVVLIAGIVFVFTKIHYTKKNGIETVGTISRIEDGSIGEDISYGYYVRYTLNGQAVEAKLSNPGFGKGLEVGAQIKIKYLPEKPTIAVRVK